MRFKMLSKTSFKASERTMFDTLKAAHPRLSVGEHDVVVFLSKAEDQMVWCYGYTRLADGSSVLQTRRLRLTAGKWDILRLKDYASRVGVRVDDWGVFERGLRQAQARLTRTAKALAGMRKAA